MNYKDNPIEKLDTNHIQPEILANIIVKYEPKIRMILSEYIRYIIYDVNHPENHVVRYINKKANLYTVLTEDTNDNIVQTKGKLKVICGLITGPITLILMSKMKEMVKKYKKDEDDDFDYSLYENVIKDLRLSLTESNISKAIKDVLSTYIISDKRMKVTKDL